MIQNNKIAKRAFNNYINFNIIHFFLIPHLKLYQADQIGKAERNAQSQ